MAKNMNHTSSKEIQDINKQHTMIKHIIKQSGKLAILLALLLFGYNLNLRAQDKEGKTPSYPALKEIIIVYKTHFDIGYSDLARNVVHKYRTEMLDHTLNNIEKNSKRPKEEQFVWTIPGWPMKQILWNGQEPSRKEAIEKAFRKGNLTIHALPFTTHTETLELEELVRGLGFSSELARKYGQELPRAAKMTDVPSHTWLLPTLLKHAGVDFFHFGCNLTNKIPSVPPLFWWEGPDGSRLLTMASQGYGTTPLPPADWKYPAWLYINQTGDNEGPPSPETVQKDIDFYKKKLPGVKVRIGKLSDFSDLILKSKTELPVVKGDMPDSWVHGPMCSPNAVALSRTVRPTISAAEALQTLETAWGIYLPDETPAYRKAYEQSLLFGEHTWGYAAQHYRKFPYGNEWTEMYRQGIPPHFKELEVSWDEHDQYIKNASTTITLPLANEIAALADNVNMEGKRIVVYNPLPWSRNGVVTQNIVYWPEAKGVKDCISGEILPIAIHGSGEGRKGNIISFEAKDVPAMGYRTYTVVTDGQIPSNKMHADQAAGTIENAFFKVRFNPAMGRIESFTDKRTGKELIDTSAPYGFGQYLYERFGKAEVMRFLSAYLYPQYMGSHGPITDKMDVPDGSLYTSAVSSNMKLSIEQTPLEISAVMTGEIPGPGMPQSVSIRMTLYADQPYADLKMGVQKQPDGWPEAGWICLPFNMDAPQYRLGRLGSFIDPKKDIIDNCNTRMLWLNSGMAVYNEQDGIGICPVESPMVSLGEPGARHFNSSYKPSNPYIYVNLYNNQWATNFREWWGGTLTSTVRIWTFDKYNPESSVYTPSMETRVPLMVARSSCKPGKQPLSQTGLSLSRKGIAVTTFGKNPDGKGIVLRVWEQAGTSGSCEVKLPQGMHASSVQPVDLRGNKSGKSIPVKNNTFSFELNGFAPASFVIQ